MRHIIHYLDPVKNRLFITFGGNRTELNRLHGRRLKRLPREDVEYRRKHLPFADEVDLTARTTA